MEKYILFFDICSSSEILEDLNSQDKLEKWKNFIIAVSKIIESKSKEFNAINYKFLGDGFIVLLDKGMSDKVIKYCKKISSEVLRLLETLINEETSIEIKRKGITMGIEYGSINEINIGETKEYIGRSLNIAARLQGSLKAEEHVNKLLISKIVKNQICKDYKKEIYKETTRSLRNISENKNFYCYEIDLKADLENMKK